MAYGKIKADTLIYDNSGSDTEVTISSLGSKAPIASPTFTGDVTVNAQGDLRLADSDSSNYVGFQAPGVVSTSVVWTLPTADGTNGQLLKTNGSNVLSWVDDNALSLIDEDNMSSDSNTRPPSQQSVKAYVDAKSTLVVADESSDTTCFPLFVTAATGTLAAKTGSNITFNSSTGLLETSAITTTGNVIVGGNLTVSGTTTTVNSTTLTVDDKNIELGSVSSPSDTTADGGGITLKGATDKTITWVDATDSWTFNQPITVQKAGAADLMIGSTDAGGARIYLDGDSNGDFSGGDYAFIKHDTDGDLHIAADNPNNDGEIKFYTADSATLALTLAGANGTFAGTVSDSLGDVRSIPPLAKTATYTPTAADAGKCITTTHGVTIDNVWTAGDALTIINTGSSDITITQGGSFTLTNTSDAATGNRTLAAKGMVTIYFNTAATGFISGSGLS